MSAESMNLAIEVRLATEDDLDGILAVERAAATAPHWPKMVYRAMLPGAGGEVQRGLFVAVKGSEVVGFAVGQVLRDEAEMESIAVREKERRHGIGKALLEAVMGWCWVWGASRVELEVRVGGLAARRLYETFGFKEVGRRTGYYTEPEEDAILMRWELESALKEG